MSISDLKVNNKNTSLSYKLPKEVATMSWFSNGDKVIVEDDQLYQAIIDQTKTYVISIVCIADKKIIRVRDGRGEIKFEISPPAGYLLSYLVDGHVEYGDCVVCGTSKGFDDQHLQIDIKNRQLIEKGFAY